MTYGFPKPSRTARKMRRQQARREIAKYERASKAASRRRDGFACRFPWCGCKRLGLPLESSHEVHKGMGGDPAMTRSETSNLITFCDHRHRHGRVSRHAGTLRIEPLTAAGCDGPVSFQVERETLLGSLWSPCPPEVRAGIVVDVHGTEWIEVARETRVGKLDSLQWWQQEALKRLAEMSV